MPAKGSDPRKSPTVDTSASDGPAAYSWDNTLPKDGDRNPLRTEERPGPTQPGAVDWDEIFAGRKSSHDRSKAEGTPPPGKDPFDWDAAFEHRRKRY